MSALRSSLQARRRGGRPASRGRRDRAPAAEHHGSELVICEQVVDTDRCVIELLGSLDRSTCDQLGGALERALETSARQIVLDLRSLSRIDAGGVHPILVAHLRAGDQHTQLLISCESPALRRVLDRIAAPFDYTGQADHRPPEEIP